MQTVLFLAAAGFAAGFVDAIAGGGGIISLPALLTAGVPPHLALGTNKLQSAIGTTVAAANYARRGLLVLAYLPLGIAFTAAGAFAGALLVTRLPADWLGRVVPFLLAAVFVYAVRSPHLGAAPRRARMGPAAFCVLFGLSLGFYDGFFGPGAGSFWTVAFIVVAGLGLPEATANTKAMNLTSNLAALGWFAWSGHLAWALGLAMGAANMTGALLGSQLAMRKGARFIRGFFLVAVGATLLRLVYRALVS